MRRHLTRHELREMTLREAKRILKRTGRPRSDLGTVWWTQMRMARAGMFAPASSSYRHGR